MSGEDAMQPTSTGHLAPAESTEEKELIASAMSELVETDESIAIDSETGKHIDVHTGEEIPEGKMVYLARQKAGLPPKTSM